MVVVTVSSPRRNGGGKLAVAGMVNGMATTPARMVTAGLANTTASARVMPVRITSQRNAGPVKAGPVVRVTGVVLVPAPTAGGVHAGVVARTAGVTTAPARIPGGVNVAVPVRTAGRAPVPVLAAAAGNTDRKSTRLKSSPLG